MSIIPSIYLTNNITETILYGAKLQQSSTQGWAWSPLPQDGREGRIRRPKGAPIGDRVPPHRMGARVGKFWTKAPILRGRDFTINMMLKKKGQGPSPQSNITDLLEQSAARMFGYSLLVSPFLHSLSLAFFHVLQVSLSANIRLLAGEQTHLPHF